MTRGPDAPPSVLAAALRGWAVYLGGLLLLATLDQLARRTGHPRGLDEPLLPLLAILLGAGVAWLLWRGSVGRAPPLRLLWLAVHACAGLLLYAFAALLYFCGIGVDCM